MPLYGRQVSFPNPTECPELTCLGLMERFNILRNYIDFYHSVSVTAVYTAPESLFSKHGGVQDLVYACLASVINDHAILGVTIADEGTPEPKWVRLETIDLGQIVKVNSDPTLDLDVWINHGHHMPFKTTPDLPLWRVLIATDVSGIQSSPGTTTFSVGFVYHHGIGDGLSGAVFHLSFRDALAKLTTSDEQTAINPIIPIPKNPLLPTLEMGTKLPLGIWFTLKIIIATFIYKPKDSLLWTGSFISASAPRPPICNTRSIYFPSTTVSKLLTLCRTNKTTMTGLISVLIARKLALIYPTSTHFAASIPISLRKFTGHTARDMGCFVSDSKALFASEASPAAGYVGCASPFTPPSASDEALWESARQVKKSLDEKAATPKNQGVGLLKFVAGDFIKFFMDSLGTQRTYSFELTNLGGVDGAVGEAVSFDRVVFSAGGCTFAPPYGFQLVTAKGGDMCLNLKWESGVVRDEDAGELLSTVGDWLKGLAV